MNLRCIYCQTPFTLSRMEKLTAIQKLQAEGLHHYDAFCPRCRRSNPVSIDRLRIFTPGWLEGLRTLEAEAAQREKEQLALASVASVVSPKAAPKLPVSTAHRKRHSSAAEKKAAAAKAAKAKPAAKAKKPAAPKKKAAAAPAPKAKAKKPAAKPASKSAAKSKRK
ncbi:MAG: hypothetical protein AB1750_00265 [Chloroflexota bacterium]